MNKLARSAEEAVADIASGSVVAVGGFGLSGIPWILIDALLDQGADDLTVASNNCGVDGAGLGLLLEKRRISRVIASYIGENREFGRQYLAGELHVELTPQGTLAERLRAGRRRDRRVLHPHGGRHPRRGRRDAVALPPGRQRRPRFPREGRPGLRRPGDGPGGGDRPGRRTRAGRRRGHPRATSVSTRAARNFNPDVAMAGRLTIVEAEQVVEAGAIAPDDVHLAGIFVQRVVALTPEQAARKQIEKRTVRPERGPPMTWTRPQMAARAARELRPGQYVNLGIGLPTLIPNYVPEGFDVVIHSENGVLGVGPYPLEEDVDPDLVNAGKETITVLPGASYLRVLPELRDDPRRPPGRGGAGRHAGLQRAGTWRTGWSPARWSRGWAARWTSSTAPAGVVVLMEHTSRSGAPKLLPACTMPLTGRAVVHRVITDLAVLDVDPSGAFRLVELADGVDRATVDAATGAPVLDPLPDDPTTLLEER